VAERYEIRALLGRGGMGAVYRAFDRVLHEEVALKAQRADAARDPDADRRFRNEVKLARQVTHPNVGRLHDGGREGGRRWISMELVPGTTVAARLRERPLSDQEAWSLAVQAAEGLAAVHRAGVVHRDLKTMNMMVDPQGRLRLMDFGIAKPAASGDTGGGGYALGSPEYMSPEQARGRPADSRSDVYSLGIVVFELFTGQVPFRADTPVATLLQHLEAAPPLDRLPEAVREVVGRALAKDPAQRYADGEAMAAALRAAMLRVEPAAHPRSSGRFNALAIVALLAVATVAVVGLVWRNTTRVMSPDVTVPSPSPSPSSWLGCSSSAGCSRPRSTRTRKGSCASPSCCGPRTASGSAERSRPRRSCPASPSGGRSSTPARRKYRT
jgi:serine/threonine-protein kinase